MRIMCILIIGWLEEKGNIQEERTTRERSGEERKDEKWWWR